MFCFWRKQSWECSCAVGQAAEGERMQHILSADIGGTNSRFAWFELGEKGLTHRDTIWLKTGEASSFRDLLGNLVDSGFGMTPASCDLGVMAVPAAVKGGKRAKPPNISWEIDAGNVDDLFARGSLLLINDFVAQAFATKTRAVSGATLVKDGQAQEDATVAAVGAGTGLGHCALVPDGCGGYVAVPAEAGHTAFAFYGPRELELQSFLTKRTAKPYVYGDIVVSGRGLSLVHEFLTGQKLEPAEVSERSGPESDTTAWFARLYGRACRHYALSVLSLGGVFLAGGVAAKNPDLVMHSAFAEEFVHSPTYGYLLQNIPVWLNANEDSGLWGAAYFGELQLRRKGQSL